MIEAFAKHIYTSRWTQNNIFVRWWTEVIWWQSFHQEVFMMFQSKRCSQYMIEMEVTIKYANWHSQKPNIAFRMKALSCFHLEEVYLQRHSRLKVLAGPQEFVYSIVQVFVRNIRRDYVFGRILDRGLLPHHVKGQVCGGYLYNIWASMSWCTSTCFHILLQNNHGGDDKNQENRGFKDEQMKTIAISSGLLL